MMQAAMNAIMAAVGQRIKAAGAGYKIVAVTVLTTSGTAAKTGSPTHTLNAGTTHVAGWVYAGGSSGRGGTAGHGSEYDSGEGYQVSAEGYGYGGDGGAGGQITPIAVTDLADLSSPISYTVGPGGASPAAVSATTSATVGGLQNAGSPSAFGPFYAAGGPVNPVSNVNSGYEFPTPAGWMTPEGQQTPAPTLATASYPLTNAVTLQTSTPPGQGATGRQVSIQSAINAAGPWYPDLSAPGGGNGESGAPSGGGRPARRGGAVGGLVSSATVAQNTTLTTAPATPAKVDGLPKSGLPGIGGTGGAASRNVTSSSATRIGGNGADGGFPGAGGGGGGGATNATSSGTVTGGRGGKGGDGCIVLIELKKV